MGILDFFFNVIFFFFFFFWPCPVACRTLVSQPGVKLVLPAFEVRSFNHWTTREVPKVQFIVKSDRSVGTLDT